LSGQLEETRRENGALTADLERQKADLKLVHHELESFSYSISHDLRAPLRHLLGFSSALVEDYADQLDEAAQGFLGCITRAGHRLEQQIEALTLLSRIARHPMAVGPVDLSRLAREVVSQLQGAAPMRQVHFVAPDQFPVQGDAQMLRAALEHLVGNAWKFTEKTGEARIELGCRREDGCEVIFVRDNGAGFDMRYAERLFGAFQRMHREGEFEGVGIGLATVQRIVHRHGGKVWAEAAPNEGCTIYFTLSGG